jgi:hypothetical protein
MYINKNTIVMLFTVFMGKSLNFAVSFKDFFTGFNDYNNDINSNYQGPFKFIRAIVLIGSEI